MPANVVDASVLGAMIFQEPRADEAMSLLGDTEFFEPILLGYELASIARKKSRLYPDQRSSILQALEVALSLDINWVEVNHLEAVHLALQTGLTTYDASYLLVSRVLDIPLLTFDERLKTAADQ